MRIALITTSFLPRMGGGEWVVHHLAQSWSRAGHRVCVFNDETAERTHPEARYEVQRHTLWRGATRFGHHRFPWLDVTVRDLDRRLRSFKPDFVSGHFAYPVALYLARLGCLDRVALTTHGADLLRNHAGTEPYLEAATPGLRHALSQTRWLVAMCDQAADCYRSFGARPEQIVRIPNGVEVGRFQAPTDPGVGMRPGVPSGAPLILTVARNDPQKNLRLGLEAFARIHRQLPEARYALVGRGAGALREAANGLGIGDRVILIERAVGDELVAWYRRAGVYLATSQWEFSPLVILEALAAGVPQVAVDIPGHRELIVDGVTGRLMSFDPEALAAAAVELLSGPEMLARFGEASRARAQAYDWGTISAAYLRLFQGESASAAGSGARGLPSGGGSKGAGRQSAPGL